MFIVYFLVILLAGSSDLSATATDSSRIAWHGLSLEAGLVVDWSPYVYDETIYRQEILSYHGFKTIHQFSQDQDQTRCSPGWDVALSYNVADFSFSIDLTSFADNDIDVYSYFWADPNQPCNNVGIDTGCELAFIRLKGFLLYRLGIEYNIWNGLYLKWQSGLANTELHLGRETYGTEDPEVEKNIYQENIWTNDLLLRWASSNNPRAGLLIEAGWGYAKGKLTAGNRFFFGLKLVVPFWKF